MLKNIAFYPNEWRGESSLLTTDQKRSLTVHSRYIMCVRHAGAAYPLAKGYTDTEDAAERAKELELLLDLTRAYFAGGV